MLEGDVVPHGRVLLLDDLGDWRGIGTAMHLQEAGGQVTLVTAAPVAAGGLFHSAADGPARRRFAQAGGEVLPYHVLCAWAPGHAVLRSTLTDAEHTAAFDWLVVAETPIPRTELGTALTAAGIAHHAIGDCVAARLPASPSTRVAASPSPSDRARTTAPKAVLVADCAWRRASLTERHTAGVGSAGAAAQAVGASSSRPPRSTRRLRRSGG